MRTIALNADFTHNLEFNDNECIGNVKLNDEKTIKLVSGIDYNSPDPFNDDNLIAHWTFDRTMEEPISQFLFDGKKDPVYGMSTFDYSLNTADEEHSSYEYNLINPEALPEFSLYWVGQITLTETAYFIYIEDFPIVIPTALTTVYVKLEAHTVTAEVEGSVILEKDVSMYSKITSVTLTYEGHNKESTLYINGRLADYQGAIS